MKKISFDVGTKKYTVLRKRIQFSENYRTFFLQIILLLSLCSFTLSAQETIVVGQVLNKADRSPLPMVNIYFKNSTKVVQSNEEGYFMIRTNEKYNTLIFSCIGFKQEQIHFKPGQSIGIEVPMQELNVELQEAFVIPGANPALDLMQKVRLQRKANDISNQTGFNSQSTEQNLVLLSKINQKAISKRIFEQLKKGDISNSDSSLVIPVYMAENKYQLAGKAKQELSRNVFSSPENGEKILEKMVGDLATELNFYNNTVTVFGKSMVSPLANVGNSFYDYYLADSLLEKDRKQYEVHFRTKNTKNLAFNGKLWIDSASLALTKIEADLPNQANINFVHNLRIAEKFVAQSNNRWTRQQEDLALNMNYELLRDSLHPKPEIFVKHSATYNYNDSIILPASNFAQSNYTQESLDDKLKDLNRTPLLGAVKWIADAFFTSYMQVGKIDIGRIETILRTTDIEGFRLTIPVRTNEKLWKNVSLGGSLGYGFRNKTFKYSGDVQFKIPAVKRMVLSLNYTNDYRRVDYKYNDFMFRENPLITGDVDISSTLFAMKEGVKNSEREEFSASFQNDWNQDIESRTDLRYNRFLANAAMPMSLAGVPVSSNLTQQSAMFTTRFSFGERSYDDHMQRIYIANKKPVIYSMLELGKYQLGSQSGQYGKIMAMMRHTIVMDFAELSYIAEAGAILGKVPYPLLQTPAGSETGGYSSYQFNMMHYMEYVADKYVNLHSELMFNGLLMNQIPLIKNLDLREICSFNMAYGSFDNQNKSLIDLPSYTYPLNKPYMEVGVGFTNILHIFTLQSVWRLTDLDHPGAIPWGITGCLRLSF